MVNELTNDSVLRICGCCFGQLLQCYYTVITQIYTCVNTTCLWHCGTMLSYTECFLSTGVRYWSMQHILGINYTDTTAISHILFSCLTPACFTWGRGCCYGEPRTQCRGVFDVYDNDPCQHQDRQIHGVEGEIWCKSINSPVPWHCQELSVYENERIWYNTDQVNATVTVPSSVSVRCWVTKSSPSHNYWQFSVTSNSRTINWFTPDFSQQQQQKHLKVAPAGKTKTDCTAECLN